MADTFIYTPTPGTPNEVYQGVSYTIDAVQMNGVINFGVVERTGGTTGIWMGGAPIWTMFTQNAALGDNSTIVNGLVTQTGEVKWQANGAAWQIINQEGDHLFGDFKGEAQRILDARFSTSTGTGPVVSDGPPFTDEIRAIAWLMTRVSVNIPMPKNGKLP